MGSYNEEDTWADWKSSRIFDFIHGQHLIHRVTCDCSSTDPSSAADDGQFVEKTRAYRESRMAVYTAWNTLYK